MSRFQKIDKFISETESNNTLRKKIASNQNLLNEFTERYPPETRPIHCILPVELGEIHFEFILSMRMEMNQVQLAG